MVQSESDYYATQDRHVRQCWKEARIVALIWLAAMVVCSVTMAWRGYVPPANRPEVPDMVWGIPSWVWWGLFVPWLVLIGVTWAFAVWVLKDDEPYMALPSAREERPDDGTRRV